MPAPIESCTKVFVYGTLKRNQPNHYWFWKPESGIATFLATARTVTKFPMLIGSEYNVPFLLNKPGVGNRIVGEVYEVDAMMLANLDVLEDYPTLYDRQLHEMVLEDGSVVKCWMYLLKKFPEKILQLPFIEDYQNSVERPYSAKYVNSNCTIDELCSNC